MRLSVLLILLTVAFAGVLQNVNTVLKVSKSIDETLEFRNHLEDDSDDYYNGWYKYRTYYYYGGGGFALLAILLISFWFLLCLLSTASAQMTRLITWSLLILAGIGCVMLTVGMILALV